MKLRSFRTIILLVVVASILALGILILNSRKEPTSNEIKNQLTKENLKEKAPPKGLKAIIAKSIEKQQEMAENKDAMTERSDFSSPLIKQERFYTEQEINEMTEPQFQELLKSTESKLPKLSDIKKLPAGALHRTPELIMEAGRNLGLLKEVLKVHENYERTALKFYDTCAQSKERPTPVRALCLTNLIEIKKKNNEKINKSLYPAELLELTKMITDL